MKLQFKIIRKKYFKILLSIAIIISLGVALLFGLMNGVLSVHKSIDNFAENNNYPDIKVITNLEDIDVLKNFNEKNYKSLDYRLSYSTILKNDNKIISTKLSTFEDKNITDFYIWNEKPNNSEYYDILVEKKFAEDNDIKLGDVFSLKIGENDYSFYVSKIISIPEAIVTSPVNGLWGKINDYGNVYINKKVLIEETNKLKNSLLNEVLKKEEELNDEENKKIEEFNLAKNKISEALKEYNEQKSYYTNLKSELNNKKNELNNNKEKLLETKDEYLETINYLDNINNKINSYIDAYENLSDNAKDYINNVIEKNYPDIKIEDLEFISDIGYYFAEGKINEAFDPSSEINKSLQNKIKIADNIKLILEMEYQQHSNNLILKEIHNATQKLPFQTFSDMYNFLNSVRIFMPILYNSYKEQAKPRVQETIDKYNAQKENLKIQVEKIYNSNQSVINKSRLIKSLIYNFAKSNVDDIVIENLSEYTNDISGGPVEIIDRLLNEINNGLNEIDTNDNKIDESLDVAYNEIIKNKRKLEEGYNIFLEEIQKARTEIANKKDDIEKIKGYESKFNEINIKVDNPSDSEVLLKEIKNNELKNVEILDSYTYDYSPIKDEINYNIVGMENVSTIIPTAFYIINLIVLFLFISLIIKQSKSEIAIFRLLGRSKNEIRLGYCISNLIVSIFGIVLGFIIGGILMQYIVGYYKDLILLPTVVYVINPLSILLCIIVTIAVVEIATILATLELDKITPIEVLSKESYQDKKISKFTKLITSIFNPLRKFSFIVYIRNKRNLILSIICTSATVALIFTSLAYVASKDKIFNEYFDDRINYDAQIFKKDTVTKEYIEDIKKIDYVENADLLRYFNVKLKSNKKEVDAVINALNNENEYIKIFDKDKNEIKYPESGIVLEQHIANELGVKKNDYVEVNGILFKIVDISFQSMGRINYISLEDSKKINSSFDTVVLKMDKNKQKDFISKVSNDDEYIYTVNYDTLREYNKKEFDSYVIPAIIIINFTMIIGFVIIININNYNLIDQKRNLSIFRSLGFQFKEISHNWFIQSIFQWITSTVLGLPVGIILSKYILKMVSSPRREYIYASGIKEMLISIGLVFIYIFISHLIGMKKLKKVDIIEEIKGRE